MKQYAAIPSELVRAAAHHRGSAYLAVAAAVVAMTPSHSYDAQAVKAWTGWDDSITEKVRRAMRQCGWLDDHMRLSGQAEAILLSPKAVDDTEKMFAEACAYIAERRGVRYKPTRYRRILFEDMAKKYGAATVLAVVKFKVDDFMSMVVSGKHMGQYAKLETILRTSNFERYLSEYEDQR